MSSVAKDVRDPFVVLRGLPDATGLNIGEAPEHRERLRHLRRALHDFEPSPHQLAELGGVAALHPDPWVRREVLAALPQWRAHRDVVAEAIAWAVHDTDDFVAFTAIRLACDLRLTAVLPHLLLIVG